MWIMISKNTAEAWVFPCFLLAGVGYICGPKISSYMFSGAYIMLILMPIIKLFGSGLTAPFAPADVLISEMSSQAMWGSYIRYIGAGAWQRQAS